MCLLLLLNGFLARELSRHARGNVEAEFSRHEVLQQLAWLYGDSLFHCGVSGSMDNLRCVGNAKS
jgi:hypothetical protein